MTFYVLTLFPQIFSSVFSQSIIKKAQESNLVKIKLINIRDFAVDKHKTVDDKPFGGGAGMILKVDILLKALESISPKPYTVLLSASGRKYTQNYVKTFTKKKNIALICGHYEGVDARIEKYIDETISIGDYILTGGEIGAMVIIDSVTRCIPSVINAISPQDESFENGLLEYPQYTHPRSFRNTKVPKVLLKGNHAEIKKWRLEQSRKVTRKNRPDILS